MNLHCQNCPHVCKRLDIEEEPEHVHFSHLSPSTVIEFFETALKSYRGPTLEVINYCRSHGDQLAVLFKNRLLRESQQSDDNRLLLLCQASRDACGITDLFFKYDIPSDCSRIQTQTAELSRIVRAVLSLLRRKDRYLTCISQDSHHGHQPKG